MVKNPPANAGDLRDTGLSLGWEDPLEEDMATPSTILAYRIPWREETGGLPSMGLQRARHDWSNLANMWVVSWCSHNGTNALLRTGREAIDRISAPIKETPPIPIPGLPSHHVWTQWNICGLEEDPHLTLLAPDLRLTASSTVRKKFLLFISYPDYGFC